MKAVVVTCLKEFCTHAHELLSWCTEDVIALIEALLHEGE